MAGSGEGSASASAASSSAAEIAWEGGGEGETSAPAFGSGVDGMIPASIVVPGDEIGTGAGFVHGHGTRLEEGTGKLLATASGVTKRVNRVITVAPLAARYVGEAGDVVVGRVVATEARRWRVDVHGLKDAVLQLSAVNLEGGAQRRRTLSDQLSMRSYAVEGDIVVADVQGVQQDGTLLLHTRSFKFGPVSNGFSIHVGHELVPRQTKHFLEVPELETELVLGRNGVIWVGVWISEEEIDASLKEDGGDGEGSVREVSAIRLERKRHLAAAKPLDAKAHTSLAIAGNIVRILAATSTPITAKSFHRLLAIVLERKLRPTDLLTPEIIEALLPVIRGKTEEE